MELEILIAGIITGGIAIYYITRLWRRFIVWRRFQRGRAGELDARKLLNKAGYRITDNQSEATATIRVDGHSYPYTVRADYIVKKSGKRYVAEVKTGKSAPDPTHSPTRRQLLEYSLAYPADGLILVNADSGNIHMVEFDMPVHAGVRSRFGRIMYYMSFAAGTAAGIVMMYTWNSMDTDLIAAIMNLCTNFGIPLV